MSLMAKLKKNSTIKETEVLENSKFFKEELIKTSVPMINVALSGKLDGGIGSGLITLAGPSKHYKSSFALLIASDYMKHYEEKGEDVCLLFYDSEFGSKEGYFKSFGIDPKKVIHSPFTNIEVLKHDIINQLEDIDESDNVVIIIDSIGNAASKKELEDAISGNSAADMTRAKQLKGLFRMITPYLHIKKIPLLAINHTYDTQEMYSTQVVSGGKGIYYSSDAVWIIGRRQVKEGVDVSGYDFIINIDKSRFVREKSKIPISVSWASGIEQYSGLLEVALATGHVVKPSNGWYSSVNKETGEESSKFRKKDLDEEFWKPILEDERFKQKVEEMYKIGAKVGDIVIDLEEEIE